MTALDHAIAWVRRERVEGAAVTVLALLLVVSVGRLWKFSATAARNASVNWRNGWQFNPGGLIDWCKQILY